MSWGRWRRYLRSCNTLRLIYRGRFGARTGATSPERRTLRRLIRSPRQPRRMATPSPGWGRLTRPSLMRFFGMSDRSSAA
jgi:hypothetical protein